MSEYQEGCLLCPPRPDDSKLWLKVATLSVSTLYLDRNQTYAGHCQLVFDGRHVEGLEQLAPEEFQWQMSDLSRAARAIAQAVQPDLMNYASMGNVVAHHHWHLIPRYHGDPRWGKPIYTTDLADMRVTRLEEPMYQAVAAKIRAQLEAERESA
ncbi:MAG: HIT family protein [Steroidobacteraceae bacterium]